MREEFWKHTFRNEESKIRLGIQVIYILVQWSTCVGLCFDDQCTALGFGP